MELKAIQTKCHQLGKEAGWWNEPRNKGELIALIHSELSEALEALRNNNRQELDKPWRKDTFEDELADVAIRLFDFASSEDINLEKFILLKLEYNKTRPPKHNKQF